MPPRPPRTLRFARHLQCAKVELFQLVCGYQSTILTEYLKLPTAHVLIAAMS
jgi:hypothetical protein